MSKKTIDGYWPIRAYTNGYQIVVMGEPLEGENYDGDDPKCHNCDTMGCGSLDHVMARIPMGYHDHGLWATEPVEEDVEGDTKEQPETQPLICTCKYPNEGIRNLTGHAPSCPVDKAFYNDRDAYVEWMGKHKKKAAQ